MGECLVHHLTHNLQLTTFLINYLNKIISIAISLTEYQRLIQKTKTPLATEIISLLFHLKVTAESVCFATFPMIRMTCSACFHSFSFSPLQQPTTGCPLAENLPIPGILTYQQVWT